jgi:fimbrial chaperone protein
MGSFGRAARLLSGWSALCLWLLSSTAAATGIEVSPTLLTITAQAPSTMLAVTNRSQEPLRLSVRVMKWMDKPDGEMTFEPTQDIVFFPSMLTLNPGEARNLRAGTSIKGVDVEKSYRVFIQELPKLVTGDEPKNTAVALLAQVVVPLFIAPPAPKGVPAITGLSVKDGKVHFTLKNAGNAHYMPTKLLVRAKDTSKVVHEADVHPWYVLAGGTREYHVEMPAAARQNMRAVEVELRSEFGPAQAALPNVACTPAPASPAAPAAPAAPAH